MINLAVCRRYAKALAEIAIEDGGYDRYESELWQIHNLTESHRDLRALLSLPPYYFGTQKEIVDDIVRQLKIGNNVRNFLILLLEGGKILYLREILPIYQRLVDEALGRVRVTVASATTLNNGIATRVGKILETITKKRVIMEKKEDPSLIGGMIIRIGDTIFDGSISTQLTRLRESLQKEG